MPAGPLPPVPGGKSSDLNVSPASALREGVGAGVQAFITGRRYAHAAAYRLTRRAAFRPRSGAEHGVQSGSRVKDLVARKADTTVTSEPDGGRAACR